MISSFLLHNNRIMSSQFFLMFLLIAIPSFLLLLLMKQGRKRGLPPGPMKLPLIGNLHQLTGDLPHISLQRLANDYGSLMFLKLGSVPALVISSADVLREIFKTHDIIFSGRSESYAVKKLSYNYTNITFASYGDYWREIRKIASAELLSSKRVQSVQTVRNEEVAHMIEYIAQSSQPLNLSKLLFLLANNIVCRVTFGKKDDKGGDDGASRFDNLLHEVQASVGRTNLADCLPWMGWLNKFNGINARLEKTFGELDRFCDEQIQEHVDPKRPKPEHEDLVDVLLRIQKDSSQTISLSNEQIKSILTDILVAGTDTSSATLGWTMTELLRNPSVMRRAQNEIREAVKGKEKVEEDDLSKLMYLKLVVKEALRLHPPAPLLVPRETTEDCVVRGYKIPSKTRVLVNAKAIATDPKYWENPYEFRPERFLDNSIDFKGQNFEFIPFGVGRRRCPGISFAIPIVELALANLLYRFEWNLPQGIRSEDLDMEEAAGITIHRKVPLCVVATPANYKNIATQISLY